MKTKEGTREQFKTEWPVYEQVDYIKVSPPTSSGSPGLSGGVLQRGEDVRRWYNPIVENPGVSFDFTNLDPEDTEQLEKFAGRYGLLGLERFWGTFAEPKLPHPLRGEYVMYWQREIIRMTMIYEVHSALLDGDGDAEWLGAKFRPLPGSSGMVYCLYEGPYNPPRYEIRELVRTKWAWEGIGDPNHPLETARRFLADVISERLYNHVNPILDASNQDVVATFNVPSLLGAMYVQIWMQLASGGIVAVKQCPVCRQFFPVGDEYSRSDKEYCSERCRNIARQKRWRQRQRV